MRGPCRHHLDGATGQAEGGGPHGVAPRPLDEIFQRPSEDIVTQLLQAHDLSRLV